MALADLIDQFGKEMEVHIPKVESGTYAIPLEEDLVINVSEQPVGIVLTSNLGILPEPRREALLSHMLLGNLFGQGTRGSVLGLNQAGNQITLSKTIDGFVKYPQFRDTLEDFINVIDFWRQEIKTVTVAKSS